MEPVTHLAAGLLTAQALRPRLLPSSASARGLTVLCAVAATIPDIDSLAMLLGPEAYLLNHRGLTHSALLLPAFALLLAWAARGLGAALTLRQGFWAAACALSTHLFLDVVTAFGTQVFAPLTDQRVSFEGVYVVDPAFTLALLGFALAARLRPARAQALALWGLTLLVCYPLLGNALRLNTQARYEALLESRDQAFDRVDLTPDALAPYYWKVIVTSGPNLTVTTATPLDIAAPFPAERLLRLDRAELLRLGEQASIFRTYAWFAEQPGELPQAEPGHKALRERSFVDAIFLNNGPVLVALFGQTKGFAQCDALFDAGGRLTAWRDWGGTLHPVPDIPGIPGSARASGQRP